MNETTKRLRAVGYCRTSSDSQKDNTSIAKQREEIERYCRTQDWPLIRMYVDECKSGSKIEGREDFQRLLADAPKDHFDIIVVYDSSRFSRDARIGTNVEYELVAMGIHIVATTGGYDTRRDDEGILNGILKLIDNAHRNKIAKEGRVGRRKVIEAGGPATKSLPWGRTWDGKEWRLVPGAKETMERAAARYLNKESMEVIALELGWRPLTLWHRMTHAGPTWEQTVAGTTYTTAVPRLLDDAVIDAVRRRRAARRTFLHGHQLHKYLLNRMIFCQMCGHALTGNHRRGKRYYRHLDHKKAPCETTRRRTFLADDVETYVLATLLNTLGNPALLERALEAARPDPAAHEDARRRRQALQQQLLRNEAAQGRLVDALADGTITAAKKAKLAALEQEETTIRAELQTLENLPPAGTKYTGRPRIRLLDSWSFHEDLTLVSEADKKDLLVRTFGGKTPDGKRMGVYVDGEDYKLLGHLAEGVTSGDPP